jgi:hypothetical protein
MRTKNIFPDKREQNIVDEHLFDSRFIPDNLIILETFPEAIPGGVGANRLP